MRDRALNARPTRGGGRRAEPLAVLVPCLLAAVLAGTSWYGVRAGATRLVGTVGVRFVAQGDTLLDIARDNNLGILEVMAANPDIDPWIPEAGRLILLPRARILPDAPERGIVINLAERRLYFFGAGETEPRSWPIGIGRLGFTTPLGETRVVRKTVDSVWRPTAEMRAEDPELPEAVPAGPDNPLGKFALYLGWPQYAIHGTNRPWGIGRRVSRGCIRLYPEGIEELFGLAEVGTKVTVVDQIAKLAWSGERLYLELHPDRAQLDDLEATGRFEAAAVEGLLDMITAVAGDRAARLDLAAIARAERERRGLPVIIARP